MKAADLLLAFCLLTGCGSFKKVNFPPTSEERLTGSAFYKMAASFNWQQRDSFAVAEALKGNLPDFLQKFSPVRITFYDTATGRNHTVLFYVAPDYFSVGTVQDWARVPLTPMAAQRIADTLHCFLPTRKMVDAIYKQASVRLQPVPLVAFRDSTPVMYHHHLIIEGQRKGRKGLIAGIKKDVVLSSRITRDAKPNRVAIYGWHQLNGQPIQPLYTGHVNWYVDYSHGIRFVYQLVKVDGRWMHYRDVLQHPVLSALLCDEEVCDFYRYPF